MNKAEVLAKSFLFNGVSADTISKLAEIAIEENFAPQLEVFREGDEGADLFILALGTVKILRKSKEGENEEIVTLASGSYFGEMALVKDVHKRTATVQAMEKLTVLRFSADVLEKASISDPKLGHELYKAIARGLAKRLSSTDQSVADLRGYWKQHRH